MRYEALLLRAAAAARSRPQKTISMWAISDSMRMNEGALPTISGWTSRQTIGENPDTLPHEGKQAKKTAQVVKRNREKT
jgi:hypothetical protein